MSTSTIVQANLATLPRSRGTRGLFQRLRSHAVRRGPVRPAAGRHPVPRYRTPGTPCRARLRYAQACNRGPQLVQRSEGRYGWVCKAGTIMFLFLSIVGSDRQWRNGYFRTGKDRCAIRSILRVGAQTVVCIELAGACDYQILDKTFFIEPRSIRDTQAGCLSNGNKGGGREQHNLHRRAGRCGDRGSVVFRTALSQLGTRRFRASPLCRNGPPLQY